MTWQTPGRSTVSAFILSPHADAIVSFAEAVFDATLLRAPLRRSGGRLWNAELRIGDSSVMLGDGGEDMRQGAFLYVYVADADATHARALAAGAQEMMPVEDQFYGDRAGGVRDPWGNIWWIATHRETLDDAALEAAARAEEAKRG